MNKNKKVIIATFIFALAIIIGLLEREKILQKFFSVLLVLVIFATIWDIYDVFKAKKHFGQTKWNIKTNNNFLALAISVYVILIVASANTNLKDTLHTKLLAMAFIAGIAYLVRSLMPNGINEKGIMHWGVFHTWDDIDSYSFTDKYLVITLKPNNKKITFIVDKDEKEMIKNFLNDIIWNSKNDTATFNYDNHTIVFTLGSNVYTVDGIPYQMDVKPLEINRRIEVPIRYFLGAFGYNVHWNSTAQEIVISR